MYSFSCLHSRIQDLSEELPVAAQHREVQRDVPAVILSRRVGPGEDEGLGQVYVPVQSRTMKRRGVARLADGAGQLRALVGGQGQRREVRRLPRCRALGLATPGDVCTCPDQQLRLLGVPGEDGDPVQHRAAEGINHVWGRLLLNQKLHGIEPVPFAITPHGARSNRGGANDRAAVDVGAVRDEQPDDLDALPPEAAHGQGRVPKAVRAVDVGFPVQEVRDDSLHAQQACECCHRRPLEQAEAGHVLCEGLVDVAARRKHGRDARDVLLQGRAEKWSKAQIVCTSEGFKLVRPEEALLLETLRTPRELLPPVSRQEPCEEPCPQGGKNSGVKVAFCPSVPAKLGLPVDRLLDDMVDQMAVTVDGEAPLPDRGHYPH
mmetsp:Transcript_70496/g.199956  ORF Transcript_70496/g.199956 Transcript_70496/m.199956 type:complete len:376 (+) Transcript_70496:31-1158(+)